MIPTFLVKPLYSTTIIHKERLQSTSPRLYIPNHTSLLDAFLLAESLPKDVVFIANTGIAKKYGWAMKGREVLTIDPMNPYSIRTMLKVLQAGKSIVIFPEGKITITNTLMKVYPGVAYLSLKTGVPLVPIAINGGEKAKFFTYLEDKIPTKWLPDTSLYIGESFTLPNSKDKLMREKKDEGTHIIYRKLQETVLKSRLMDNVHLMESFRKRVNEAPNLVIAEEMVQPSGKPSERKLGRDTYTKVTMKELWQKSIGLSLIFQSHIEGENPVGILLPTSITNMATTFAVLRNGWTPAMLNASMDANTLSSCLRTGNIHTIITSRQFVEKGKLEGRIEACEKTSTVLYLEDMASELTSVIKLKVLSLQNKKVTSKAGDVLLFTSGSEGTPKGVLLTHDNIYANIQQALLTLDFTSKDKIVNALPMFHSFGMILTFLSALSHIPTLLIPSPLLYKAIPELTYDRRGTVIVGTSTFLSAYGRYAHPYDFAFLRHVVCGAEKLQDEVRTLWMDKFGHRVLEGYGMTETAPILSIQSPLLYKKGSVGCFVPGVKARLEPVEGIKEGGRLHIQAPNLMKGYLIAEKGFVKTPEWFDTGDVVSMDAKGFVTIQGRAKRFVKVAGEMISLLAVEQYAREALGTEDVVAIGMEDAKKGERIELVTTLANTLQPNQAVNSLREYWKKHQLSQLSLPSHIHSIKSIPLLGSGKVDVTEVKKQVIAMNRK